MAKYEFEPNAIFHHRKGADPDAIGKALEDIARNHDERLRPDDVVEEARKRNHPLHRYFEWNDDKAAEAYRLDQARAIIRSIRIVAQEDVNQAAGRAYHSIQDHGRSYRSIGEIQISASLQLSLYHAALRDLKAWENRYRGIATICPLVNVARERLEEAIAAMEAKAAAPPPVAAPRSRRRPATQESRPA